jgi:hypothetical protein
MGFLNKLFKKKEDEQQHEPSHQQQPSTKGSGPSEQPRRVKRYTSDGKPVYGD